MPVSIRQPDPGTAICWSGPSSPSETSRKRIERRSGISTKSLEARVVERTASWSCGQGEQARGRSLRGEARLSRATELQGSPYVASHDQGPLRRCAPSATASEQYADALGHRGAT